MTKSEKSSRSARLRGSQEPSERIAPRYSQSDSYDALKILKIGGTSLDPWQADILEDWLARTSSGRWACPTCGGSVPRQNGKTLLLQARMESGMLLFNEHIIYTAHLQKTATETFEEMRDFFESPKIKKYVAQDGIKSALGREQIILKSGARVKFLARTRNGGRGQHGDLLIFDEAQELDDDAQASFLPAISASLNPQTVYVGTPPDANSTGGVFRGIRNKALSKKTKKAAWFEFSVKDIGDVTDKTRWTETNPALGRRIQVATIESELEQMAPDTFARERLGWWSPEVVEEVAYAIDRKKWLACASEDEKPEGKTAYGVKFTADGSMVALCGAVIPKEGKTRISLIKEEPMSMGIQWLADWLNERYTKASCVVIDGRNGTDILVDRIKPVWKAKISIVIPSARDVVSAGSELINQINENTLTWYKFQDSLNDSAVNAEKRSIAGGFGFGGGHSAPIEACALALWGAKNSKRNPNRKMKIG